ncbi:tRNA1(Val) (adenine(37)-N6)-methyltransferase [Maribellus sp. YY47]|uniref:tRNA1(Val) (adenine(37)-N6)-methyltransferase n=1 Tax=Maribellus sp. YY47 TaxID=2929486 RepID=UPI00200084E8|nr:tRNA1(Val) (adenine(37)-N6)-methyltransferase [Maribellus sp. YY47]MCK3683838.1 tRNA1(Val) (adenine(37)-N6)-methyltransferase [Maribellus sp. YY47]
MGRNNYFQFKQFKILQEKSAMKVGVDGVLLGAWVQVNSATQILDVGTGTGLIALMLAQRSDAQITAIDIEEKAVSEATMNVNASVWKDRIEVCHASLQEFARSDRQKFDLIVSNPPFFSRATRAAFAERTIARHNDFLPFPELISCSAQLLTENGRIALILPFEAMDEIRKVATNNELWLQRKTDIFPKTGKKANRVLLEWGMKETVLNEDSLTIYDADGSFTKEYVTLTRDFYLKF